MLMASLRQSIHAAGSPAQSKSAYRFMNNKHVEAARIVQGAAQRTREAVSGAAVRKERVLILQDRTELEFRASVKRHRDIDLPPLRSGPNDGGWRKGVIQHGALAVGDQPGQIYGLVHAQWDARQLQPEGETRKQRRDRPRESDAWLQTADAAEAWWPREDPQRPRLVHVADREADDFRFFNHLRSLGHGFVVRSQHNRKLGGGRGKLHDHLNKQPVAFEIETLAWPQAPRKGVKPRRPGPKAGTKRIFTARWDNVILPSPTNDASLKQAEPLAVGVVMLKEKVHPGTA